MQEFNPELVQRELSKLIAENSLWGRQILENFNKEEYRSTLRFYMINYVERICHSLEATNILFPHIIANPYLETSIGLILRSGLLDFITVTYLSAIEIDGKTRVEDEIERVVSDQIGNSLGYLKSAKSIGNINSEEYDEAVKGILNRYYLMINETSPSNGSNIPKLKRLSVAKMIATIAEVNQTKHYATVYDSYMYYSKYEHFGIQTHELQTQGQLNDFCQIAVAMNYCFKGLGLAIIYIAGEIEGFDEMATQLNVRIEQSNQITEQLIRLTKEQSKELATE